MPRIDTHPTPNPHSLKITVADVSLLDAGMVSFSSPGEAEGHPLGEPLFELPGVDNVFITPEFVTVTKEPETAWDDLLPKIERLLEDYCDERAAE